METKLILLIFCISSCQEKSKIIKFKIEYQTLTTTIDSVSCDTYDAMFSETDKEIIIENKDKNTDIYQKFYESTEKKLMLKAE